METDWIMLMMMILIMMMIEVWFAIQNFMFYVRFVFYFMSDEQSENVNLCMGFLAWFPVSFFRWCRYSCLWLLNCTPKNSLVNIQMIAHETLKKMSKFLTKLYSKLCSPITYFTRTAYFQSLFKEIN